MGDPKRGGYDPSMETSRETQEQFEARVEQSTGMKFSEIPKGEPGDIVLPILEKKGNVYVVGFGYPDEDEDTGEKTYHEFRVVDLSDVKE